MRPAPRPWGWATGRSQHAGRPALDPGAGAHVLLFRAHAARLTAGAIAAPPITEEMATPSASLAEATDSSSSSLLDLLFDTQKGVALLLVLAAAFVLVTGPAFATCKSDAADKKLAGAALKSFMTKCEKDAKAACEKSSADMKLAGAAKTSHMKKCTTDATGI